MFYRNHQIEFFFLNRETGLLFGIYKMVNIVSIKLSEVEVFYIYPNDLGYVHSS